MTLPPGVSSADFSAALGQFAGAVGKEWVFTSDEDVSLYRDYYSPLWGEEEEMVASAAVAPDTVEQVQAIVRIANQYRIPIYPISTGRNLAYGGSSPTLAGSVCLDLKRMNRVLEVNERNASCLVEPGVTYFDLYRAIQDQGAKLWIDCPDPGWGSPVGNSLDHGLGYTMTHVRDHFEAHCGMEVVLPNGEVLRTGPGAVPGSKIWQEYKYGYGPHIDGMFSQSNLGVVTKMGFWLAPEPEAYRTDIVKVYRHQDLVPLMDAMSYLTNQNIINGYCSLGTPLLRNAQDNADIDQLINRAGGPDHAALERYAQQHEIPYWTCQLRFYGLESVIDAHYEHSRELFSKIDGVRFEQGHRYKFPLSQAELDERNHLVEFGIPNLAIWDMLARSERNPDAEWGHFAFSSIIPKTGEAVFEAQRVFSGVLNDEGIPNQVYASLPPLWLPRAALFLIGLPVSRDVEVNKKSRAAFVRLTEVSAERGWCKYRAPVAFHTEAMNTNSYNNHVLRRFHETIKDAVDPNGIIAPGRSGIWPVGMREEQV